jgi:tRNA(Ile)-lysidine synthase
VGPVVAELRRFVGARGLTGPGAVAVSGGADSVALLRGLVAAGVPGLVVAHFNHRLRGAESDADEAFVKALAGRLGLRFVSGGADVAAAGGNTEAAARRLRYDWLAGLGAEWVATGHTADDQAETVLHRLVRGTGLDGLQGIAAERAAGSNPTVRLVRPLLALPRTDLLAYLAALDQPFRTDSSNADRGLTRNRIRHDLLPLLKTFNPQVVSALGRLAEQAAVEAADRGQAAADLLAVVERPRAGPTLVLDAAQLLAAPPGRVRDALRRLWAREGWPVGRMSFAHWVRAAALTPGDYPDGVRLRRAGRVVQLARHA